MKYKLIACKVFEHEVKRCLEGAPHQIETVFIDLGEHARPAELRKKLQALAADSEGFDAVLLCYGLCGRATEGLRAGAAPIILIRNHDCGGILLGSRKRFEDIFKDMPSTPFSSIGYVESGSYFFDGGELVQGGDDWQHLVDEYGEEDARYVWDAMHPKLDGELQPIHFISMPEIDSAAARQKAKKNADKEGRKFKDLEGSIRLIKMLVNGDHPAEEFLTVRPGESIRQTGDWDEIIRVHRESGMGNGE